MKEAGPSSPEEVPPQESRNVPNDFKADFTGLLGNHNSTIVTSRGPKMGQGAAETLCFGNCN